MNTKIMFGEIKRVLMIITFTRMMEVYMKRFIMTIHISNEEEGGQISPPFSFRLPPSSQFSPPSPIVLRVVQRCLFPSLVHPGN